MTSSDRTTSAENGPSPGSDPSEAARRESQTRRTRPATATLAQAAEVFFRHPSPRILGGLTLAGLGARALLGRFRRKELLAPLVTASSWPLIEWGLHRYVLHLKPFEVLGHAVDPYFAVRHRRHHSNPSYFPDVFLPSGVIVGAYVAAAGTAWFVSRDPRWVATVLTSLSAVTLAYEWTHYVTHADYRPRSAVARRIWRNHRMHHYRSEHHWYAFMVPSVDDWLGTGGEPGDVEPSATVRTLGVPSAAAYEP